jgi:hypothetical protein
MAKNTMKNWDEIFFSKMMSHLVSFSAPGADDNVNYLSFSSLVCQFREKPISFLFSLNESR